MLVVSFDFVGPDRGSVSNYGRVKSFAHRLDLRLRPVDVGLKEPEPIHSVGRLVREPKGNTAPERKPKDMRGVQIESVHHRPHVLREEIEGEVLRRGKSRRPVTTQVHAH